MWVQQVKILPAILHDYSRESVLMSLRLYESDGEFKRLLDAMAIQEELPDTDDYKLFACSYLPADTCLIVDGDGRLYRLVVKFSDGQED